MRFLLSVLNFIRIFPLLHFVSIEKLIKKLFLGKIEQTILMTCPKAKIVLVLLSKENKVHRKPVGWILLRMNFNDDFAVSP